MKYLYKRGVLGGVFGVVLGECLANTHPVGVPLYKGIADDWGECWPVLTRLLVVGNEK